MKDQKEVEEYLATIRQTIAKSESLIAEAELRIAETDRFLESQGLTREQVLNFHFTQAQREAVNEELKRRGLDPLEKWEADADMRQDEVDSSYVTSLPSSDSASGGELAERQRKFGMMMKPFQI